MDAQEPLVSPARTFRAPEGGDLQAVKAWIQAQQSFVRGWLRQQQLKVASPPLRRLEISHGLVRLLLAGGDGLQSLLDQFVHLDEQSILRMVPQITDVVVLGSGSLDLRQCQMLRRFLLCLCSNSQHAALHVCFYLRAMTQQEEPGHHRGSSGSSPQPSSEVWAAHALALAQQIEDIVAAGLSHSMHLGLPAADNASFNAYISPVVVHSGCGPVPPNDAERRSVPPREGRGGDYPSGTAAGPVDRLVHLRQTLDFVKKLADACVDLMPVAREARSAALQASLERLEEQWVPGAWLPVGTEGMRRHAVQALLPSEAVAVSTNKHCPAILHLLVLLPLAAPVAGLANPRLSLSSLSGLSSLSDVQPLSAWLSVGGASPSAGPARTLRAPRDLSTAASAASVDGASLSCPPEAAAGTAPLPPAGSGPTVGSSPYDVDALAVEVDRHAGDDPDAGSHPYTDPYRDPLPLRASRGRLDSGGSAGGFAADSTSLEFEGGRDAAARRAYVYGEAWEEKQASRHGLGIG